MGLRHVKRRDAEISRNTSQAVQNRLGLSVLGGDVDQDDILSRGCIEEHSSFCNFESEGGKMGSWLQDHLHLGPPLPGDVPSMQHDRSIVVTNGEQLHVVPHCQQGGFRKASTPLQSR